VCTTNDAVITKTNVAQHQGWRISYRKVVARRVPLGGRTK
jgi:hypothetical protein